MCDIFNKPISNPNSWAQFRIFFVRYISMIFWLLSHPHLPRNKTIAYSGTCFWIDMYLSVLNITRLNFLWSSFWFCPLKILVTCRAFWPHHLPDPSGSQFPLILLLSCLAVTALNILWYHCSSANHRQDVYQWLLVRMKLCYFWVVCL